MVVVVVVVAVVVDEADGGEEEATTTWDILEVSSWIDVDLLADISLAIM